MSRPLLLDLFCGAGGAAQGYSLAGFDVVGVDLLRLSSYPFPRLVGDAVDPPVDLTRVTAIHASPPCQAYSTASPRGKVYPDLIPLVRGWLRSTGLPYVIENVPPAPLEDPVTLCGSSFGLLVRRHRKFETNWPLIGKPCDHLSQGKPWGVYGHGGGTSSKRPNGKDRGRKAAPSQFAALMEMPWATPQEIVQAIPPAYTKWIGDQLMEYVLVSD